MFYFGFYGKTSVPIAIYNGRTAFVRRASPKEAEAYFDGQLKNGELFRSIEHEHKHQSLFLLTKTGRLISGLRLVARYKSHLSKNGNSIFNYYLARSVFYIYMYKTHENFVDHNTTEDMLKRKKEMSLKLKEIDKQVLDVWGKKYLIKFKWPFNFILEILGYEFCRHFCIVTGSFNGGKWVESWSARTGFINDRCNIRSDDGVYSKLLKKYSQYLQIEHWISNKLETDWRWILHKFKAEHKVAKSELGWNDEQFDLYMTSILCFATNWSKMSSVELLKRIADAIWSYINTGIQPKAEDEFYEEPGFRKTINFFYLHGN